MLAFNNLLRFRSKEFSGSFNVYQGWPSFTVWPFTSGAQKPTVRVALSITRLIRLKGFCEKILASTTECKYQMEIWFFNKELNDRKYDSTIILGRDAQGICFIECSSVHHMETIRFDAISDDMIYQDGQQLPKVEGSIDGMKAMIAVIDNLLPTAMTLSQAAGDGAEPAAASMPIEQPGF